MHPYEGLVVLLLFVICFALILMFTFLMIHFFGVVIGLAISIIVMVAWYYWGVVRNNVVKDLR